MHHYLHHLHHSLAPGIAGREYSPSHQQKTGLNQAHNISQRSLLFFCRLRSTPVCGCPRFIQQVTYRGQLGCLQRLATQTTARGVIFPHEGFSGFPSSLPTRLCVQCLPLEPLGSDGTWLELCLDAQAVSVGLRRCLSSRALPQEHETPGWSKTEDIHMPVRVRARPLFCCCKGCVSLCCENKSPS